MNTEPVTTQSVPIATISGSSRDLLAMLLGRPLSSSLNCEPDDAVAAFQRAFPGP